MAVASIQKMDPELNCLSQYLLSLKSALISPLPLASKGGDWQLFKVVTYLGGLKKDSDSIPREAFPAALGLCAVLMYMQEGGGKGKTEWAFMFSVWVERTNPGVCVNPMSHLFDRL